MTYVPNDLTDLANYPNVDPVRIYQDIVALDNLLSGNLTQDNISPDARFPLVNLATPYVTENISLAFNIQAPVVSGHKVAIDLSSSALYAFVSGTASWIGTGGTPVSGNTFQVLYGQYVASGFASAGNVVSATNWYAAAASAGRSALTLQVASVQAPTTLVLYIPAVNTPPSGGHLSVTLQTITYLV